MITNDTQLEATLERIKRFQLQVRQLRKVETDPRAYQASVSGFIAELDRMNLDVREYLSLHPTQQGAA